MDDLDERFYRRLEQDGLRRLLARFSRDRTPREEQIMILADMLGTNPHITDLISDEIIRLEEI